MKMKLFAMLAVLTFAFGGAALAQTGKKTNQVNAPVGHLPASDGVFTLDMKRLLNEALPQTLAGSEPMLADVLSSIDKVKARTGVDLRQFEEVAAGVSIKKNAARELDFDPIILARGTFNAAEILAMIKNVAGDKYREEKIGQQTVYIFSPRQAVKIAPMSPKPNSKMPSVFLKAIDRMVENLSREVAVSANFDGDLLAIGSPARLRETFTFQPRVGNTVAMYASPRISQGMLGLVNRKPNSLASFALKLPEGMSDFIQLGDDEIGKNLDAIRYLSGAVDVSDGSAQISILAKTAQPEQAKSLQEQLDGLKSLGKILIGGMKGADKQIFARMLDNVKIARNLGEITIDLQVPQSDINTLLNKKNLQKTEASLSK